MDNGKRKQRPVLLAAVLDKGSTDVAAVVVSSHSPDIIGGDHC
jgi:hypothetical protein